MQDALTRLRGRHGPNCPRRSRGQSACCRSARSGPRTRPISSARPTTPGGGSWVPPIPASSPSTACCAAGPGSTSAASRPSSGLRCSTRSSAARTRRPSPSRTRSPGGRSAGPRDAGVESLLDLSEDEWRRQAGQRQEPDLPGVPAVRPRGGRGTGRGHRLGSRVPPRRLAAAPDPGTGPEPGKARELADPAAFRPPRPALAPGPGQTVGPAAAELRASASAPCSPTSPPSPGSASSSPVARHRSPGRRRPAAAGTLPRLARQPGDRARRHAGRHHRPSARSSRRSASTAGTPRCRSRPRSSPATSRPGRRS